MDANVTFKVPAYLLPGKYLRQQTENSEVFDKISATEAVDTYKLSLTMSSGRYHTIGMEQIITHSNNGGFGGLTTDDFDLLTPDYEMETDIAEFPALNQGAVDMMASIDTGNVDVNKVKQLMMVLRMVNGVTPLISEA